MRVALVIDNLNSGGAQRQLCMLSILLKRAGYEVQLFIYHPQDFFRPTLDEAGIAVKFVPNKNYISRILAMRREIRGFRPDVAIAFLSVPSFILELAGLPFRRFGVIVSERSGRVGSVSWRDWIFLNTHRLADAVVTNSSDMKRVAEKVVPALRNRLHVILNCVDLDRFRPAADNDRASSKTTKLVVVARVAAGKNALGLADAMRIVRDRHPEKRITVDWYGCNYFSNGEPTGLSGNYLCVQDRIKELNVEAVFRLKPPVADITPVYQAADAVLLPSFFEGCSNVICEALACGRPVLASNVCDNSRLVKHGINGFLFDPHDVESIAAAIVRFESLSSQEKLAMGRESRRLAERELCDARFVRQYVRLIESVCRSRRRTHEVSPGFPLGIRALKMGQMALLSGYFSKSNRCHSEGALATEEFDKTVAWRRRINSNHIAPTAG